MNNLIALAFILVLLFGCSSTTQEIVQQQKMAVESKEVLAHAGPNLIVLGVTGFTNTDKTKIENITISLTAAAGTGGADLSKTSISITANGKTQIMRYSQEGSGPNSYSVEVARDPAQMFKPARPRIDGSTLVAAAVILKSDLHIAPNTDYEIKIESEGFEPIEIKEKTMQDYKTSVISLFP